jgi:hypothetical protein
VIQLPGLHGFVDIAVIVADRVHGADTSFVFAAVDAQVVVESREDGLFLRPVSSLSRHACSKKHRAEFLLSNAADGGDYRRAVETVRAMGLEPENVSHERPIRISA